LRNDQRAGPERSLQKAKIFGTGAAVATSKACGNIRKFDYGLDTGLRKK
jgi:hypothetical protein